MFRKYCIICKETWVELDIIEAYNCLLAKEIAEKKFPNRKITLVPYEWSIDQKKSS